MLIEWLDGNSLKKGILKEDGKTKLKVETLTGRSVSLPAKRFHIRHLVEGDVKEYLTGISEEAQAVDLELLHSAVDAGRNYTPQELAEEWFSRAGISSREISIVLVACLQGLPWFRVGATGQVKVALPEAIKRWEKQEEEEEKFRAEVASFENALRDVMDMKEGEKYPIPDNIEPFKQPLLEYLIVKTPLSERPALEAAFSRLAADEGISYGELARKVLGAASFLPSAYQIQMLKFYHAYFLSAPEKGRSFLPMQSWYPECSPSEIKSIKNSLAEAYKSLPAAQAKYVFTIDHSSTEEIDDAISVEDVAPACFRVGVHIAAAGAYLPEESGAHRLALQRGTTVYQPDCKWAMLPRDLISFFSLRQGQDCPVVSAYFLVSRKTWEIRSIEFLLEKLSPSANLSYEGLEKSMTGEFIPGLNKVRKEADYFQHLAAEDRSRWPLDISEGLDESFAIAARCLVPFCRELFFRRHRNQAPFVRGREYVIQIGSDEEVEITPRKRNSAAENIVSELMILMNSSTAEKLAASGCPAIYRTQRPDMPEIGRRRSRADLTINPREHGGIGASLYCWATSPIRRYADLINQRQLASMIGGPLPAFTDESELLIRAKKVGFLNQTSLNHQRRMERYWVLKYLEKNRGELHPVVLHPKDKKILISFENIPFHINIDRGKSFPDEGPAFFRVLTLDYYTLEIGGEVVIRDD